MNLPAFRQALIVLRSAKLTKDGGAFIDGVAELLERRDELLGVAENCVEWCCGLKAEKNFGEFCSACAPAVTAIKTARGES